MGKKILGKLVIFSIVFLFSFGLEDGYAKVLTYKPLDAKIGTIFKGGEGGCVDFVKANRPDLAGISYSYAKNMPAKAAQAGFRVDKTPEVGAVIVLPKVTSKVKNHMEVTGHVGIVQNVERIKNGKYKGEYNLTIIDDNFDKTKTIGKAEYVYNPDTNHIEELNYSKFSGKKDIQTRKKSEEYSDIKFIHENEKVVSAFKQLLGRKPNSDELTKYSRELLKSPTMDFRKEVLLKYAKESSQYQDNLRKNIKRSLEASQKTTQVANEIKKASEERATIEGVSLSIDAAGLPTVIGVIPAVVSALNSAIYAIKLLGYKQTLKDLEDFRSAQQLVTPVKASFTERFEGTFTQIPDYSGATTAHMSVAITDGERKGAGSRPGKFTGSYTARTIAEPGWYPIEHHNTPIAGITATGSAEAIGFKEGPLKGKMTVNWESTAEKITLTSNKVTISTDGSLTAKNLNGSVTNKSLGVKEASFTNGSLNQIPK